MSTPSQKLSQVVGELPARQRRGLAKLEHYIVKSLSTYLDTPVRLSAIDSIRAIRWVSWSKRVGMSLTWVLDKSFEWGNGVSGARIKYRRRKNLFPMTIAVMTGNACFEFVKSQAELERNAVPDSTVSLQAKMMNETLEAPECTKILKPLEYANVDQFSDAYVQGIRQMQAAQAHAEIKLAQTKPFRGNPFR